MPGLPRSAHLSASYRRLGRVGCGGPAVTALVGGHVQMQFATPPSALPHVTQGRLRPLAVSSANRSESFPELPTIAEAALPGYEAVTWWGLLGPARLPREIVTKIHADVVKVVQMPDVRERLVREGVTAAATTPEQFQAMIDRDIVLHAKIVKTANIRID